MRNLAEQARGTNPLDPDSDHDGLPDGAETSRVRALGFGAATRMSPYLQGSDSTVAADIDGDGDLDLVENGSGGSWWRIVSTVARRLLPAWDRLRAVSQQGEVDRFGPRW